MMNNKPKQKILIVDDDPGIVRTLTGILETDYELFIANNGKNALKCALNENNKPNLILLDVMLPDMDGYQICRELKTDGKTGGIPINDFSFPRQGTVIIGSEELGISPEAKSIVEESAGIVTIPTYGAKGSLNVSVAFGILMYYWYHSVVD